MMDGTNRYWPFYGRGMDSFGVDDAPISEELPHPSEGEVLARVDAYAICASDAKMVRMGVDYPLFKGRDFSRDPARLGHELCLTVVEAGERRRRDWPAGRRFGVQPDVYLGGERFCIGVNVPGGMAEYILLGSEVFESDNGSCAFPVADHLSCAAVAQTEPVACIEASFQRHTRSEVGPGDVALVYVDRAAEGDWDLSGLAAASSVTLVLPDSSAVLGLGGAEGRALVADEVPEGAFDVVAIVGNPDDETMRLLVDKVAPRGIVAWLPAREPDGMVEVDVARVHYESIALCGSMDRSLATALDPMARRDDYEPGGTLVISGGAGAMGRFHVMRALQHEQPPSRVVVTDMSDARLDSLAASFSGLAEARGIELATVNIAEEGWGERLAAAVGPTGASDIIACAPGVAPVECVAGLLRDDGMLVLFAGTKYGSFAKVPLGLVPKGRATIVGHSGSGVEDQLRVIEKMDRGTLDPNVNVAAVAGLLAGKEALAAVGNGLYAGKIIVYPHLAELPLTPMGELASVDAGLAAYVEKNGWTVEAERLLAQAYDRSESN